jgi:hypothetical protein
VATTARFTAVGVFTDRPQAETAIEGLQRAGFRPDQIGIAIRKEGKGDAASRNELSPHVERGAATGAAAGAALGAVTGAAVTGLIPGLGPVIATGLLAGILGGTALGAAAGGVLGALVGLGVPEEDARYYDREFVAGKVIVAVQAAGRSSEAAGILRRCGAYRTSAAPDLPANPQP